MHYADGKPTVWAYNITTKHALFEGNIKNPRPTAGIAATLGGTDQDIFKAEELHNMLLSAKHTIELDDISKPLKNKFDSISIIASGYSKEARFCTAFLITKNDMQFSIVLLGIKIVQDILIVSSKIIKDHLI
jgi:hypothetical protein